MATRSSQRRHANAFRARTRYQAGDKPILTCNVSKRETDTLNRLFANAVTGPDPVPEPSTRHPHHAYFSANSVMSDDGVAQEYRHLRMGKDALVWLAACAKEIGRLAQGSSEVREGTNTMHFIHPRDKPAGRHATYLRIVATLRPQKDDPHRIRFTVCGNRLDYAGPVSTETAEIHTANCLINSVISTKGARFLCLDIKDFYLNTPMNRYEYMWIQMADIPEEVQEQYKLKEKAVNGKVLVEIRKGMYGLKQAGRIASDRLKEHLAKDGYVPCALTPGLFTHVSRKIKFALCVDDFGVKYERKADALHLIACLNKLYTVSEDWTGGLYLGMTLEWNYDAPR